MPEREKAPPSAQLLPRSFVFLRSHCGRCCLLASLRTSPGVPATSTTEVDCPARVGIVRLHRFTGDFSLVDEDIYDTFAEATRAFSAECMPARPGHPQFHTEVSAVALAGAILLDAVYIVLVRTAEVAAKLPFGRTLWVVGSSKVVKVPLFCPAPQMSGHESKALSSLSDWVLDNTHFFADDASSIDVTLPFPYLLFPSEEFLPPQSEGVGAGARADDPEGSLRGLSGGCPETACGGGARPRAFALSFSASSLHFPPPPDSVDTDTIVPKLKSSTVLASAPLLRNACGEYDWNFRLRAPFEKSGLGALCTVIVRGGCARATVPCPDGTGPAAELIVIARKSSLNPAPRYFGRGLNELHGAGNDYAEEVILWSAADEHTIQWSRTVLRRGTVPLKWSQELRGVGEPDILVASNAKSGFLPYVHRMSRSLMSTLAVDERFCMLCAACASAPLSPSANDAFDSTTNLASIAADPHFWSLTARTPRHRSAKAAAGSDSGEKPPPCSAGKISALQSVLPDHEHFLLPRYHRRRVEIIALSLLRGGYHMGEDTLSNAYSAAFRDLGEEITEHGLGVFLGTLPSRSDAGTASKLGPRRTVGIDAYLASKMTSPRAIRPLSEVLPNAELVLDFRTLDWLAISKAQGNDTAVNALWSVAELSPDAAGPQESLYSRGNSTNGTIVLCKKDCMLVKNEVLAALESVNNRCHLGLSHPINATSCTPTNHCHVRITAVQSRFYRINCADSLDRTNLGCFFIVIALMPEMLRTIWPKVKSLLASKAAVRRPTTPTNHLNTETTPKKVVTPSDDPFASLSDSCSGSYGPQEPIMDFAESPSEVISRNRQGGQGQQKDRMANQELACRIRNVLSSDILAALSEVFVNIGDTIAYLYTGTPALHSGVIRFIGDLSGPRSNMELLAKRYIQNRSADKRAHFVSTTLVGRPTALLLRYPSLLSGPFRLMRLPEEMWSRAVFIQNIPMRCTEPDVAASLAELMDLHGAVISVSMDIDLRPAIVEVLKRKHGIRSANSPRQRSRSPGIASPASPPRSPRGQDAAVEIGMPSPLNSETTNTVPNVPTTPSALRHAKCRFAVALLDSEAAAARVIGKSFQVDDIKCSILSYDYQIDPRWHDDKNKAFFGVHAEHRNQKWMGGMSGLSLSKFVRWVQGDRAPHEEDNEHEVSQVSPDFEREERGYPHAGSEHGHAAGLSSRFKVSAFSKAFGGAASALRRTAGKLSDSAASGLKGVTLRRRSPPSRHHVLQDLDGPNLPDATPFEVPVEHLSNHPSIAPVGGGAEADPLDDFFATAAPSAPSAAPVGAAFDDIGGAPLGALDDVSSSDESEPASLTLDDDDGYMSPPGI